MNEDREHPLLEVVLESVEIITELFASNKVIKEIPVVGTAIKLCKAHDSIRDHAFAEKIQRFVLGLGEDSEKTAALCYYLHCKNLKFCNPPRNFSRPHPYDCVI